jgi:hypothetical protein
MLTVGAVMAVIMAMAAGPASADDWDHGDSWKGDRWNHDGCWEWSWVFERWKYECDDRFWGDRHHNDFGRHHNDFFDDDDDDEDFVVFANDFDRHDKKFDRHRKHRNR